MKLIAAILFSFTCSSYAQDIKSLCARNVEGSYLGVAGKKRTAVRINIICNEPNHMLATFASVALDEKVPGISNSDSVSFTHAVIDDGQLVLSDFPISHDDRRGHSSKGMISFIRVSVSSLLKGEIRASYFHGMMEGLQAVHAHKDHDFPLMSGMGARYSKMDLIGVYQVAESPFGKARLIIDVLDATPVILLRDKQAVINVNMIDGPRLDGSGIFSAATPEGNGGEPDDRKLFVIRGRIVAQNHLQFYLITPGKGVLGPFSASRTSNDFHGDVESIVPHHQNSERISGR